MLVGGLPAVKRPRRVNVGPGRRYDLRRLGIAAGRLQNRASKRTSLIHL